MGELGLALSWSREHTLRGRDVKTMRGIQELSHPTRCKENSGDRVCHKLKFKLHEPRLPGAALVLFKEFDIHTDM